MIFARVRQGSKKKIYLPPNAGGLGLIKLSEYITSLQCSWIKRTIQHWGDNWRFDIKNKCYGNTLLANSSTFGNRDHPVLHNICHSFEKFVFAFTKKETNFKKALIVRHVTGNDQDYLRKIPRVVVQKSALL
jgi:hypothetical protein